MDLKLTDEEKLIKETAAQFVDKELVSREVAYLKQAEPFLPPGARAAAERPVEETARLALDKLLPAKQALYRQTEPPSL